MKSVGSIFLITIFSFLLGFVRDLLVAREYGGGVQSDVLFLSLSIPVLVENLLGVALRDALIPYFVTLRANWQELYRSSVVKVGRTLFGLGIVLLISLFLFHEFWLQILAPGWDDETIAQASVPFKLGAFFVPVLILSYYLAGLMNASERLVLPMARSVFLNIGCLAVLLMGDVEIQWVLAGMLCGVILHLAWMRLALSGDRVEDTGKAPVGSPPSLRETISSTAVPLFISTVAIQATFVAERFFASWLDEGSISYLSYAYRITTAPAVIFSFSFVTVIFPSLVSCRVEGDQNGLNRLVLNGVKIALLLLLPSTLFVAAYAEPLIRVMFERGEFSSGDTLLTSSAVVGYALGLPGLALTLLGTKVAVSLKQASMLIPSAILTIVVTILMDLLLFRSLGVQGLALACSAGITVQALFLWWRIYRSLRMQPLGKMLTRFMIASLLCFALLQIEIPLGDIPNILIGGSGILLVFLGAMWALGERRLISADIMRFREVDL